MCTTTSNHQSRTAKHNELGLYRKINTSSCTSDTPISILSEFVAPDRELYRYMYMYSVGREIGSSIGIDACASKLQVTGVGSTPRG